MLRSSQPRRGVTFFEVLILLAILLFLAALLLPYIAQVRRTAGRTQSFNNLRQMAFAAHLHNDQHRSLPPAVGKRGKEEGTAHYFLLPYIEQNNLVQNAGGSIAKIYGTVIPTYIDLEDPTAPPGNRYKDWLATTNYAANWMLLKDSGANLAAIPDGTSNTLLFATRYQMCNGHPTAWGYPTLYYWSPVFAYYSQAKFQVVPGPGEADPALAQALSRQGITVALADASVRLIDNGMSPETWGRLCDPADGQALGDDF